MRRSYLCIILLFVSIIVSSSLSYAQTNVALSKGYTLSHSADFFSPNEYVKLTDGVSIANSGDTTLFIGYGVNIPTITVDLGSSFDVVSMSLYAIDGSNASSDAAMPNYVEFFYSVDGVSYARLGVDPGATLVSGRTYSYDLSFASVNARYFRFYVDKYSDITQVIAISEIEVYSALLPSPTPTPTPLVATQMIFVQQPSDTLVNALITPSVSVQFKDDLMNNVSLSQAVDISLFSGTGVLSGVVGLPTDSTGLVTFSNLSIDQEGVKNLKASSSGFPFVISETFNILPVSTPTPTYPEQTPTPQQPTPTPDMGTITASFGGVVYGCVVDKYKIALPEIKVEYSTVGDEYLGRNPVLTDNDGYYYFEDVDTQFGYGLLMTGKRYGTITLNFEGTVRDSVVRVPDEVMVRGNSDKFTLSGVVKDLYLSPVEHARVRVKSSGSPRIVYTDSLGAFSFSDLPIGTYTVTAKHSGYYVGRVKYSNTDGLDVSVEVSLQER